ncbi:nitrate reductase [Apiospora kogelbergensis]|uniref:Nitrate reductase n=1 Tax=Apiospora kogelbergensis TaxID=1337665 RepID=A0AAW0Q9L4_9PEZI
MSTSADTEYSAKEVALHKEGTDAWMTIHGEVYDVTKYLHDHPGGADVLVEAAGMDASEAFDNAGHSEDAFEIMEQYRVGKLKGAKKFGAQPVKVTLQPPQEKKVAASRSLAVSKSVAASAIAAGAIGGLCYAASLSNREIIPQAVLQHLKSLAAPIVKGTGSSSQRQGLGFFEGILAASAVFAVAGTMASHEFSKMVDFHANIFANPTHMRMPKSPRPDPLLVRGWLHPSQYQSLPLIEKVLVAPNVYRFVFELPNPQAVAGLPIGQHVSIAGPIDEKTGKASVSRSYTPVSNNSDKGVLELVIRCYPDGQLTGGYLAGLEVGDEVAFRGPKGAMRYRPGLCRKIGMVAGGTGITPMYQLIRAICENERDLTEVSLVYANRSEADMLLRAELEAFARRYPKNLKLHYLVDEAPAHGKWAHGVGRVNKDVMAKHLPAPAADTKIMLCGPPGMVKGASATLVELGFEKAAATSKMSDQVFVF